MTQGNQKGTASKAQRKKRLKAEQQLEVVAEPTEYAKSRPRRERQEPRMALGHTSESLELLICEDFVGPPGSGAPQAQPFRVSVNPQVPLLPVTGSASPDRRKKVLHVHITEANASFCSYVDYARKCIKLGCTSLG